MPRGERPREEQSGGSDLLPRPSGATGNTLPFIRGSGSTGGAWGTRSSEAVLAVRVVDVTDLSFAYIPTVNRFPSSFSIRRRPDVCASDDAFKQTSVVQVHI